MNLLIAGVSTRAAADSAARAGFAVTAIDAFGDLDQHPAVRVVSLAHPFTAHAAARAAQGIECDAVAYLASFENHPKAVSMLAAGRALWGNPPEIIRRVRDPVLLTEALHRRGFAVPRVRLKPDATQEATVRQKPDATWLVKPLASGGGQRIRPWPPGEELPRGCYLQERLEGLSGSVVFVAAGGRAVALGVSRQLVGEQAFGAQGYQYCGSILAEGDDDLVEQAVALARAVAVEFGLVGLNGIDFISRNGRPCPVEVNPRWCASMELVEGAYGVSVFEAHASACANGALPAFDLVRARRGANAAGKAVVYARHDVTVGDTRAWLAEGGSIRDITRAGERIPAGRPVCTVFATGRDAAACHSELVRSAERVYARLAKWENGME